MRYLLSSTWMIVPMPLGRNSVTSSNYWHCPVFERDAETMPAFAPVPAAQDLLPPMVSLHRRKPFRWKLCFSGKECASLQIWTLLFMQEARSAVSQVCSLDISCFLYSLHASCASCFGYVYTLSKKSPKKASLPTTIFQGRWPAVCFLGDLFHQNSWSKTFLVLRSLCQGCRAPALSWGVWQMARCQPSLGS